VAFGRRISTWRLTVDSLPEAQLLARIAAGWIEDYGVQDSVFVAYFGAGQNNYTIQHELFTVCSWLSYRSTFLIAP
jgi:hypothetical protein